MLYPALFLPAKGHLELVNAVGSAIRGLEKRIVILLAGDGPLRDKIAARVNDLNLNGTVRILGFRRDILDLINISDLVLLTSRSEAFGYVVLEAMALSRPVLATDTGSLPELVKNGFNGELVSFEEMEGIVEKLNSCCRSRALGRKMGANGRKLVRRMFELERMITQTEELYSFM